MGIVLAHAITVVTGYGYITDTNGHVISYAQFTPGSNPILPSGQNYTEVANQADMYAVPLYVAPISPAQAFSTDIFVQQLAQTSLLSDPSLFSFYAVMKDMTYYKNFQGLANMMGALLQANQITQSEVDIIDNALENQQINLDSYNSEVNVAY